MKNLQKISFLAVCGLWISTSADAMSSSSIFNNQKSNSGSVVQQISDQENIEPNDSRPAKRQKLKQRDIRDCLEKSDTCALLNSPMTEEEKIFEIIRDLAKKKKTFSKADILRTVEERISKDRVRYNASKIQEIGNKVIQAARHIGNNGSGDDLYWRPIHNYQKNYKGNFLHPIRYSSESKKLNLAIQEWDKIEEYEVDEEECICGKKEIKHVNKIRNRRNGNELYPIGSCCIGKFAPKEMAENYNACKRMANKISTKILRLRETIDKGEPIKFNARLFSEEFIRYLNENEVFKNDSDYSLLLEMRNKRRNSEKKEQIDKIIKEYIVPYIQRLPRDEKIVIDRQMLEQLKEH